MTATHPRPRTRLHRLTTLAWWRSYAGMVVAMFVGMAVGHVVSHPLVNKVDSDAFELGVMAFWMSVGMVAWMAFRRHGVRATVSMVVAMNLPFVVVVALLAAGAIDFGVASTAGHVAMLIAMGVSMVINPCAGPSS
ncbi:MAG: hypothetical protein ACT4QG_01110 [Sporichthyaceae bacterium]